MDAYSQAQAMVDSAERILITTHERPDGDAVGSLAGLKRLIENQAHRQGRKVQVQLLFLTNVPEVYEFLLSEKPWILTQDQPSKDALNARLDEFDLIIIVDTCARIQLSAISGYLIRRSQATSGSPGPVLIIDHHLGRDEIGTVKLIDTNAGAAGQIVFELASYAGWPMDPQIAEALLVAIGTDTGWFRFENTSPAILRTAGDLLEQGIQADGIYQKLYQNFPPQRLKLISLALATLAFYADDRLAVMEITQDMLSQSGARRSHIENIVNEPQQIGSVIVVALFVEQEEGGTRCSLRSKSQVDVNQVARSFGGGGHARAAGLKLAEPLPQAREKVIQVLLTALEEKDT